MGLFSTKKKTHVYTSVSRMIEDNDIRASSQTAVVEFVLKSTTQVESDVVALSLTDQIRESALNSLPAKMDKFFRYAKSGQYHYGLPKSSTVYANSNALSAEVQDILEKELGTAVQMSYARIGEPNYFHFAWKQLIELHGYDSQTNEIKGISAWEKFPCYLKDIVMVYTPDTLSRVIDTRYFDQWGISASAGYTPSRAPNPEALHTPYREDAEVSEDYAEIVYEYKDAQGVIHTKYQAITFEKYINSGDESAMEGMGDESTGTVNSVVSEADYVMGCGTYTKDGKQVRHYFTYVFGSGRYPSLDGIYESDEDTGQYYPRLYARLNNTNLADKKLKDTEAYKSSMRAAKKMDLTWNEWVNQIHESISDTGNIHQCFMMLALPANTDDQLTLKYVFKYFHKMYASSDMPRITATTDAFKAEYSLYGVKEGAAIVIADEAFTQSLNYLAIGTRDIVGSIGEVGTYKMSRGKVLDRSGFMRINTLTYHSYCYQITKNTYREVRVYGLALTEQVSGGNATVSSGDSENLLIPIDRAMRNEFSSREREILYSKGLHIVLNTLQVVKTKWYMSGVFKVVMFIAAVVLSVFTGGQSITLYAVAMAAAQAVLIGLAITVLAKLAVKIGINVKIVAAIAIVAMIYAGYLSLSNTTGLFNASAGTVLQASNAALNFSAKVGEVQVKEIAKDKAEFETSAREKDEALKEAKEQLWQDPALIDASFFLEGSPPSSMPYLNLYQSPNDYYTRTVHSGNPAVSTLDMVSSYVEQALTLPNARQTLKFLQGS
ncbi:hypothetical protein ABTD98_14030 [Acinetobacter baumannii]|uniref:hypothetical protein n=1 Tax=Acinetobacter baumannii TaxID=470 RepID=UPI0026DFC7E8|nr:hypothetical protein [Acinetobacter baumannii]MDO5926314.1 hypothetical protein [Acinetobacter baumannii]HDU7846660.1 hypothetical protein [Acinetobacter baumannii]